MGLDLFPIEFCAFAMLVQVRKSIKVSRFRIWNILNLHPTGREKMAVGQSDVAVQKSSETLLTLLRSIAAMGTGPGGTPHGDIRQVFGQLAGNLNVPLFSYGTQTIADQTLDYEVKLWFVPKIVVVYLEAAVSTQNMLYIKHASMGTAVQTDKSCCQIQLTAAAGAAFGTFLKLEVESSTTTPKDANGFTVDQSAIATNGNKLHWLAIG